MRKCPGNRSTAQHSVWGYTLLHLESENTLVKNWQGRWGEYDIIDAKKGPRSPYYRGTGTDEEAADFIYILRNPKGFHNTYRKPNQQTEMNIP